MKISLSNEQKEIIKGIEKWFANPQTKPYITLGGYAGTGKTTLIGYLSNVLRINNPEIKIAFVSYTGKAVRVMAKKLNEIDAIKPFDKVSTIHQLIYEPIEDEQGNIVGWKRRTNNNFDYNLIIVDEASMVNENIFNDLLEYTIPIIAVGDHGQLPPIEGKFNLMHKPDIKLETIYRQEKDNPIIFVSKMARERGIIPIMEFGPKVIKLNRRDDETQELLREQFLKFDDDTLILVGFNNTRVKLNKAIRNLLGFDQPEPDVKDKVICLRNNYQKNIYNGMIGIIKSIEDISDDWGQYYKAKIELEDQAEYLFEGLISYKQFNNPQTLHNERAFDVDLFDFGYALTVHKAQGSQAKKVILFEERFSSMDNEMWKKWLYTGITRASEELYIIS